MQTKEKTVTAASGAKAKKVAILFSLAEKGERSTFLGILDYMQRHEPWFCLFDECWSGERMADFPMTGVDGVIVSYTAEKDARDIAALHVPVVFIEPWPEMLEPEYPLQGVPYVRRDSRAIGAEAARYYLSRGYRSFAYVGEPRGQVWSAERRRGFEETLAEAGFGCAVYEAAFTQGPGHDWPGERKSLVRFLQGLPRATAVFAPMDRRARLVLEACLYADLSVPDEIAVLGVDDDRMICDSTAPTLSSIHTGGFRRGRIAAEMLDALMNGREPPVRAVSQPPIGVVTRGSTGYGAMNDPAISKAISFIRRRAKHGNVDVAAVVRASGCSRRNLEQRFRSRLGFSIHDEIIHERIDYVKSLLAADDLSIGEITERADFSRESNLAKTFKKETGRTMTEWRRENRDSR